MFACLYRPAGGDDGHGAADGRGSGLLEVIAGQCSPRYEVQRRDLVTLDVRGLDRLFGPPQAVAGELRREAASRGVHAHVAVAATWSAAAMLALARPGVTVAVPGAEREALAGVRLEVLDGLGLDARAPESAAAPPPPGPAPEARRLEPASIVATLKQWGLRTLGEFAALPAAAVSSRLGRAALGWQALARGEDVRPLAPTRPEERFEATLELEWPIADLEPLSFVLTRLLEPLSARLERRDRAAAAVYLRLRLVTRDTHARALQLPAPLREARTLRTLLLLDLESHPPPAAIDAVTVAIDPTPGRILQHTLFARPHPTPDRLSTLVARLGALMGQDRIGAPAILDTHRPGAFGMVPFEAGPQEDAHPGGRRPRKEKEMDRAASIVASALRRCRHPVPARAVLQHGRPVRVTTDRRGLAGGAVRAAAGPWRTSGEWWLEAQGARPRPEAPGWDREEWDVALGDGGVYRVFRDCATDRWYVDAIVD